MVRKALIGLRKGELITQKEICIVGRLIASCTGDPNFRQSTEVQGLGHDGVVCVALQLKYWAARRHQCIEASAHSIPILGLRLIRLYQSRLLRRHDRYKHETAQPLMTRGTPKLTSKNTIHEELA